MNYYEHIEFVEMYFLSMYICAYVYVHGDRSPVIMMLEVVTIVMSSPHRERRVGDVTP